MDKQQELQFKQPHNQYTPSPYLLRANIKIGLDVEDGSFLFRIYPSYENTFVIIEKKKSDNFIPHIFAKHINNHGAILKQQYLGKKDYIKAKMMTEKHIIFQAFDKSQADFSIIQWDLQTNELVRIKCGNVWYNQMFLFPQTKLICVVQRSNKNVDYLASTNQMLVSIKYYKFPLKSQNDEPVHKIQQNKCLSYYDEAKKFNNHSGIIWFKKKSESKYEDVKLDYFTIHILDLREKNTKLRTYKIDDSFNEDKIIFESYIVDFWEVKSDTFYIQFRTQLNLSRFKKINKKAFSNQEAEKILQKEKIQDFIWNLKQNKVQKFKIIKNNQKGKDHSIQFSSGLRAIPKLIKHKNKVKNLTSSWCFEEPNEYSRTVDFYYVNFETQQIICIERAQEFGEIYYREYFYPDFNHNFFISAKKQQSVIGNKKREEFSISLFQIQPMEGRTITTFLMTELIHNCDEALLETASQLIWGVDSEQDRTQLKWILPKNIEMINADEPEQTIEFQTQINNNTFLQRGKNVLNQFIEKVKINFFNKKQQ